MSGPSIAAAPGKPRRHPAVTAAIVGLLAVHFLLAVGSKLGESTTSDELVHLTGGMSYWQNHDYRLHPENGILPQRWAALPAWLGGAAFPPLAGNDYWRTSDAWVIGHQFFYESGEDHFPRLMAGRAMIALFSVATGLLVFAWSRRLFGDAGGLVSLAFYAFCPTFLAHGALVTSDMCMTFFFLAAVGAWWRHLHDGRWRIWWLSAFTLGLAFVAKYSAVLLPPMLVLMAAVRALAPGPLQFGRWRFASRAGKFGAAALSAAGQAVVAMLVIWAFYGFRASAFNPSLPPADHFIQPWAFFEAGLGPAARALHALADLHVLPEGWLFGLTYVLETSSMRAAFLNGAYSTKGWPEFFLWCFLLKTTLALLAACGLAGWTAWRRWATGGDWRRDLYRVTPLVVLFVVYWLASVASHLNIGQRHLMPTYPVLFIAAGSLGAWFARRHVVRSTLVAGLLGWQVLTAVLTAPHFLAYFNALGGGPRDGWRHLVDSSLDWGQDLPGLATWLREHNTGPAAQPVYLSYFGSGEPHYYRLEATRLPFVNAFKWPPMWYEPGAGIYCVSATMLQQVYSEFSGDWTMAREREFQALRTQDALFREYWRNPAGRPGPDETLERAWARYDLLRFARLCHYLRVRPSDAHVGHSIFIYRLGAAELAAATSGSLADWTRLIEQAVAPKP